MGRMAQIMGERMVRALRRLGWELDRQSGSHAVLTRPGANPITVPIHRGKSLRVSGLGGFVSTEYRKYDGQWGAEQFCARGDCARKAPPHGMWRTRVSVEHGQLLERCVGTLLAHPLLAIESPADEPAMLDGYAAEVQYIDERNRFVVYRNHPNIDSEKRSLGAFMTCVCAMIDPTGDSGQSVLYGDCALFK